MTLIIPFDSHIQHTIDVLESLDSRTHVIRQYYDDILLRTRNFQNDILHIHKKYETNVVVTMDGKDGIKVLVSNAIADYKGITKSIRERYNAELENISSTDAKSVIMQIDDLVEDLLRKAKVDGVKLT